MGDGTTKDRDRKVDALDPKPNFPLMDDALTLCRLSFCIISLEEKLWQHKIRINQKHTLLRDLLYTARLMS